MALPGIHRFIETLSLNLSQPDDQLIILAFKEFLSVFVQPDVHEANFPPNYYNIPLRSDDLSHWQKEGVRPLHEQEHGVCLVQAVERAHKRILDIFCDVLATLKHSYHENPASET
ncbi:hypothetical protein ACEQ8H_008463 [Pleosporales sp. CAS-2024a]